jgi:hypothetical protein
MQIMVQDTKLYTFFFEYNEGTYITQVKCKCFTDAPLIWAEGFDLHISTGYSKYFEKNFHDKLIRSVSSEPPTDLSGMVKTWYVSSQYLKKKSTIHFTETQDE